MILRYLRTIISSSPSRNLSEYRCHNVIDVHPKIKNALENSEPVVALESTIITHGMPYPQNLETAIEVENVVRSFGATPATIACIHGRLKVGLSSDNLAQLAKMNNADIIKSSRRDLPFLISNAKCGGTTVAATMIVAHMAGIKIFATGGVGGVHRDGHISMDISADLIELGRTPIAVVSSGIKSILDIPRTLEFLETQGVCVAALNSEEGKFPDFYTRDSGCKAPYNLQSPKQAANLIKALHYLRLQSGILIGVPIPHKYAIDKDLISAAIDEAYYDAIEKGVKGKDVTPFLLAAITKITKGTSLNSNMALVKNNAKVAAEIATELSNCSDNSFLPKPEKRENLELCFRKPLIIGGTILDFCLTIQDDIPINFDGATYQTLGKQSAGGVGRNLAESIYKLYGAANFVSVVGNDIMGQSLLKLIPYPIRNRVLVKNEYPTSYCFVLFDKLGNCKMCFANLEIHKLITPRVIKKYENLFESAPIVIVDANLGPDTIKTILEVSNHYNKPVFYEPTDMLIAGKPFKMGLELTQPIRIITPNVFELKAIAEVILHKKIDWNCNNTSSPVLILKKCRVLLKLIEKEFDCILVTMGSYGILVSLRCNSFNQSMFDRTGAYLINKTDTIVTRFYAAPCVENIVNVSGAGDSFSSGFLTGLLRGLSVNDSILFGFVAATQSLQSHSAVPDHYFQNTKEEQKLLDKAKNSIKFKDL